MKEHNYKIISFLSIYQFYSIQDSNFLGLPHNEDHDITEESKIHAWLFCLFITERQEWKEKFSSMGSLVTYAPFAKSPATSCKMTCSFLIWLSKKLWWWTLFLAVIYLCGRKWKIFICVLHVFLLLAMPFTISSIWSCSVRVCGLW